MHFSLIFYERIFKFSCFIATFEHVFSLPDDDSGEELAFVQISYNKALAFALIFLFNMIGQDFSQRSISTHCQKCFHKEKEMIIDFTS